MKFKTTATTAALAAALLSGGVLAASAQTVTFLGDSTMVSGGQTFYTYSYSVSSGPSTFSFADANVTGPGTTYAAFPGYFQEGPSSSPFVFASVDAPSADEVTAVTAGNKSFLLEGPAPATIAATPEPSAMVSMSILGACLGLGILAKRRKSTAN